MEAFDWRFLPSQLLAEDESLMDDLFTINQMASWVKEAGEIEQISGWSTKDEGAIVKDVGFLGKSGVTGNN